MSLAGAVPDSMPALVAALRRAKALPATFLTEATLAVSWGDEGRYPGPVVHGEWCPYHRPGRQPCHQEALSTLPADPAAYHNCLAGPRLAVWATTVRPGERSTVPAAYQLVRATEALEWHAANLRRLNAETPSREVPGPWSICERLDTADAWRDKTVPHRAFKAHARTIEVLVDALDAAEVALRKAMRDHRRLLDRLLRTEGASLTHPDRGEPKAWDEGPFVLVGLPRRPRMRSLYAPYRLLLEVTNVGPAATGPMACFVPQLPGSRLARRLHGAGVPIQTVPVASRALAEVAAGLWEPGQAGAFSRLHDAVEAAASVFGPEA